jgi:hypothetical protein
MKDLIRDLLEANAATRNEALNHLRRLHHDIPRSVAPASKHRREADVARFRCTWRIYGSPDEVAR